MFCRVCLRRNMQVQYKLNIYYINLLETITDVKMKVNDILCCFCLTTLRKIQKFINTVKDVDSILKLISIKTEEDDNEVNLLYNLSVSTTRNISIECSMYGNYACNIREEPMKKVVRDSLTMLEIKDEPEDNNLGSETDSEDDVPLITKPNNEQEQKEQREKKDEPRQLSCSGTDNETDSEEDVPLITLANARKENTKTLDESTKNNDFPKNLLRTSSKEDSTVVTKLSIEEVEQNVTRTRGNSNVNESLLHVAVEEELNSELPSEIDLNSYYEANAILPNDGSDYEPEEMTGQNQKETYVLLENAVKSNCSQNEKKTNNKKKRTWNRKNACCYCKQLVTNFSRHLLRHHKNEHEVLLYASINDSDMKERKRKRQEITDKLRNCGNFLYNNSIANEEGKDILPNRRVIKKNNNAPNNPSGFVVCKNCFGTFKRPTFFKHLKSCEKDSDRATRPGYKKRVISNKTLPILPNLHGASEELKKNILPHLRNDVISDIVKHDFLILSFGTKLLQNKNEHWSQKYISSKMRDLATLLQIARKENPDITMLNELLDPFKYDKLVDCVKRMCGFHSGNGVVKITSIPARLRPSLLSCVDILYTQTILDKSLTTAQKNYEKKRLDDFKLILEANWQWEISSTAESERKKKNMSKETVLRLDKS